VAGEEAGEVTPAGDTLILTTITRGAKEVWDPGWVHNTTVGVLTKEVEVGPAAEVVKATGGMVPLPMEEDLAVTTTEMLPTVAAVEAAATISPAAAAPVVKDRHATTPGGS